MRGILGNKLTFPLGKTEKLELTEFEKNRLEALAKREICPDCGGDGWCACDKEGENPTHG